MKGSSCFVLFVLGMSLAAAKLPSLPSLGGLKDKLPSLGGLLGGKASFPAVVTFGDSMTDTGNTFRLTNGTFPDPKYYYDGRFTGALGSWADIVRNTTLSSQAGSADYAHGGATACYYPDITGRQAFIPSMVTQVEAYLNRTDRPKGKKIFVLWGGHNDILSAFQLPAAQIPTIPPRVVTCIMSLASKLLAADPEATVLIGSMAPMESTPYLSKVPAVVKLVNGMNTAIKLGTKLLGVKYPNRVALWDVNKVITDALASPASYGFKFVKEPCVVYKASFEGLFKNFTTYVNSVCTAPNEHMFYDPLHPSPRAHTFIAKAFFNRVLELKLTNKLPALAQLLI